MLNEREADRANAIHETEAPASALDKSRRVDEMR